MFEKLPQLGDTPPDGDFARYVERLGGAAPPRPGVQPHEEHTRLPGASAPGQQGSRPVGRQAAAPGAVKRAGSKSQAATNTGSPFGLGFLLAVFVFPVALSWPVVWWMPELAPVQGLIAFALVIAAVVMRVKQAIRRRAMAEKGLKG